MPIQKSLSPGRGAFSTAGTAALLACLVLTSLLLASCAGMRPLESTADMSTAQLMAEADQAYAQERFERSELYYSRLLQRPDLDGAERVGILKRLSVSALESGHEHQAKLALDQWLALEPEAAADPEYVRLEATTLFAMGRTEAVDAQAAALVSQDELSWKDRAEAAALYAGLYFDAGRGQAAVDLLTRLYAQAPGPEEKSVLERVLYGSLQDVEDIDSVAASLDPAQRLAFPGAVMLFEQGRRLAAQGMDPAPGLATMQDALSYSSLADKLFFSEVLHQMGGAGLVPGLKVVLAVPITGRYKDVGRKVVSGAGAAQWALTQAGIDVTVKVVNTDAPGWVERIAALPGDYMVVGGPLTVDAFNLMADTGLPATRAVFAFLPGLGDFVEGRDAWRFFPSRQDEVRSLVSLAINDLGIHSFGVLYPQEEFGVRMMEAFETQVVLAGGQVVGNASYPPGEHTEWGGKVAEVLNRPVSFDKDAPLPPPPFGAVFLPDGWTQAQLLVPNFFYYDAADMVFLGPNLWSRALDEVSMEEHYFKLSVCPGSWWPESPGAMGLQTLLDEQGLGQADFWVALGHDFVRVAAALGAVPAGFTPEDVNQRLARAGDISFSLAPVRWDGSGLAHQDLFLFSPGEEGKTLTDVEVLKKGVAWAKTKRAKRLETYRAKQHSGN